MYENKWKDNIIEGPEFNPEELLGFKDTYKFHNYTNVYGKGTPQHTCENEMFLEEPLIKHYLELLKDFDIRFISVPVDILLSALFISELLITPLFTCLVIFFLIVSIALLRIQSSISKRET